MGARGAKLLLIARHLARLQEVCGEVRNLGGSAHPMAADLTVASNAGGIANTAVGQFGSFDILINNAGISTYGPFDESSEIAIHQVLATNLEAMMQASRTAVSFFKKQGHGTIVNIGSIGSFGGAPWIVPYTTTKTALRAFTNGLRLELDGFHINVIGVYPGVVRTSFERNNESYFTASASGAPNIYRLGPETEPDDLAKAVVDAVQSQKNSDIYSRSMVHLFAFLSIHFPRITNWSLRRRYGNLLEFAQHGFALNRDPVATPATVDVAEPGEKQ